MITQANIFVFLVLLMKSTNAEQSASDCYSMDIKEINLDPGDIALEDVLDSERQPRPDKTVFFHITNCWKDGYIRLPPRQECAIESAALNNPTLDIFVLFSSPSVVPSNSSKALEALFSYTNIFFRNNNLWSYTEGTPAEQWFKTGVIFQSKYLVSHLSDLSRLTSLYRFGGIYMDIDVVVIKSFEDITLNFAGAEDREYVDNGIIGLESQGFGHELATEFLKMFVQVFDGSLWNKNGPMLITNILRSSICSEEFTDLMTEEKCSGFKVYPPNVFYAVHWKFWEYFFEERFFSECILKTNDSFAIHVWNTFSVSKKFNVHTKNCYGFYAQNYCPTVFGSLEETF